MGEGSSIPWGSNEGGHLTPEGRKRGKSRSGIGGWGTDLPHPDNPGNPCDIQFWALFWGVAPKSNEGGHLTPGMDP